MEIRFIVFIVGVVFVLVSVFFTVPKSRKSALQKTNTIIIVATACVLLVLNFIVFFLLGGVAK
ncbi:MAG: hypothetical protein UT90_C0016G0023 [Parcubacteria group bacterium GW2011_GWA1_40_21]|nr:MAG: hypothetical protein UT80_C0025G0005 [Parcubacteria group bacterium GW2011_GWC1_40_13]KKR53001.1 MAG: hypothetical protein UT90_C0016G0023 [Parcubacteria group bacterium GW2011_GWA1_40_21]HBB54183.1 hypothetical protein [Candidatus Nomurabacteria bacterium]